MNLNKLIPLLLSFLVIIPASVLSPEQSLSKEFIIWSHSDIQPKTKDHLTNFPVAAADIASNIGYVDVAITAGDIVEKKNSAALYLSYLETRKRVNAGAWLEIAGNHEWRDIETYRKIINPSPFYSLTAGNMLILMMSNEAEGRQTVISEDTFRWWKQMVIENQGSIIITVTHASLKNSGLLQSRFGINRQFISDSSRFEDVLKNYRVDIWISGHSHLPGYLPYTDYKNEELGGTVFIDNGAIREDFAAGIESRILLLYPGTDRMVLKHRDHSARRYSDSLEKTYRLSKTFIFRDGEKIEIIKGEMPGKK